jgi:hypothetical protein
MMVKNLLLILMVVASLTTTGCGVKPTRLDAPSFPETYPRSEGATPAPSREG